MVQSALDLKVWKELAINKQLLIKTATDALGLDPEVPEDELKTALEKGVKQITEAKLMVNTAKRENQAALDAMQSKLDKSETQRIAHEASIKELTEEKQNLEALLESTRTTSASELKKANSQLDEKTRALKNINVALADTPENVVKKLKTLNKKKFDEATARKRAEDEARTLKKAKQDLKKKLEANAVDTKSLVEKYRELHELGQDQYTQLKPLVDDEESLVAIPKIEDELLEKIEKWI